MFKILFYNKTSNNSPKRSLIISKTLDDQLRNDFLTNFQTTKPPIHFNTQYLKAEMRTLQNSPNKPIIPR